MCASGHGYGHAVRSAEVARVLMALGARVVVRTDAPAWLFPESVEHIPSQQWALDIGVAQKGGLDMDIDATRALWDEFASELAWRARAEGRLLRERAVDIVVGDIPPMAFLAAQAAELPSIAVANFTWDWIYAAWPGFETAIEKIQCGYRCADVLLRLPLHSRSDDAFAGFARIEDVPLIAREARRSREDVRADLQVPLDRTLVLLSFGGFSADGFAMDALGEWSRYTFVITPPLAASLPAVPPCNVLSLPEAPADYVSLLAACDVVITKPGYGIVADCVANRVPILFTDRGPFREYDVLAAALPELGRARYISRDELLRGHVGPHVDALLSSAAPWQDVRLDGARVIADRVLSIVRATL